jgi:hypothetical protein
MIELPKVTVSTTRGLKAAPLGPFTGAMLRKHPGWQEVLKDPF